jgi:hypothetical protein
LGSFYCPYLKQLYLKVLYEPRAGNAPVPILYAKKICVVPDKKIQIENDF